MYIKSGMFTKETCNCQQCELGPTCKYRKYANQIIASINKIKDENLLDMTFSPFDLTCNKFKNKPKEEYGSISDMINKCGIEEELT